MTSCGVQNNSVQHFDVNKPWQELVLIEKNIIEPFFKNESYNVVVFGAIPDGKSNCTEAFKKAIQECSKNGGGKVVVPAGKYFTGPIHLEDNVNLHLETDAEILFSTNPNDFPIVHTSFEGLELMNYSPLIYAKNKKNIAITGNGVLNGQANETNWWPWKGSTSEGHSYGYVKGNPNQQDEGNLPTLMKMAETNVQLSERVFGNGHLLRPNFLEPFECTNVLIQGVKIVNAPFWVIHPFKCNNVIVDGVTIESHGPNNDGCDPEYSKNVLIKNCTFNTGDDCIAIKAGRDAEGRRIGIKTENVIVRDCKMIDGHGGVVIGSEMSAGVSNVFVENCEMDSPNLDRAIRIKSNSRRGGVVDGVYVRNINVGQVKEAVLKINMHYAIYANQTGEFIPQVRNVILENVKVMNGGKYAVLINGQEKAPVENVIIKDVIIEKVKENYSLKNVASIYFINTYINNIKIEQP